MGWHDAGSVLADIPDGLVASRRRLATRPCHRLLPAGCQCLRACGGRISCCDLSAILLDLIEVAVAGALAMERDVQEQLEA
jgi:hypothetical protein